MFRWNPSPIRLSFIGGVLLSLIYPTEARRSSGSHSSSSSSQAVPITGPARIIIIVAVALFLPCLWCSICLCAHYKRKRRLKTEAEAQAKADAQAPAAAATATREETMPMIIPVGMQYPVFPEPKTFDYPKDVEEGRGAASTSSYRVPEYMYGPPPEYTEPNDKDIPFTGGPLYTYPPPTAPPDIPKHSLKSDV